MKVLAIKGSKYSASQRAYICEVDHSELEKFLNLYYDKLPALSEGEEIDLARGYNFESDISDMLDKTQKFIAAHDKATNAIMAGIRFLAQHTKEQQP